MAESMNSESPRRAFIRSATIGLGSLLTGVAGCSRSVQPTSADEEMESLRRIDPKLYSFRQVDPISSPLADSRAICVSPEGALFCVGDHRVEVLTGMGGGWDVEGDPGCIAIGPDGRAFVGFGDHIEVFDRGGRRISSWPPPSPPADITAIAAGKEAVWVADSGAREVVRCDFDGKVEIRFGKKDAAAEYPGLIAPSPHLDVALNDKGNVVVSNPGMHRIETHSPDGKLLAVWGKEASTVDAFCGCCNPTDFALFKDGRFVTAEKGIPRVKVYGRDGSFQGVVAGPEDFPSSAMDLDVAIAADGKHVLVLEPRDRVVKVYEPLKGASA